MAKNSKKTLILKNPEGATVLSDQDLRGLIPSLTTQSELNEFEALNILSAMEWAFKSRILKKDLLSASGLILLHKKMFGKTWKWAGVFRTSQTSVGIPKEKIQNELGKLVGDVHFWLENKTFEVDEIAARFHHKLVWIHLFPNGNGRFARLATDVLLSNLKEKKFTWGRTDLKSSSNFRATYIKALQKADRNPDNIRDLIKFAKT